MGAPNPTEFQSVDGYYQPQDGGLFFSLSPMMAAALVLLLGVAVLLGWWLGRRRTPTDDPCESIYDAIRKAIATAAGAPRDSVMIAGRRLKSTIDDRLGAVLKLSGGLHAPCADLDQALEGVGHDLSHDHGGDHDKPDATPTFVINARRDVTIHASEPPRPDAEEAPPSPHEAPTHGHGHAKPLDAREQVTRVRAAVHALSDHWTDKPARLAELRAARRQLIDPPTKS